VLDVITWCGDENADEELEVEVGTSVEEEEGVEEDEAEAEEEALFSASATADIDFWWLPRHLPITGGRVEIAFSNTPPTASAAPQP